MCARGLLPAIGAIVLCACAVRPTPKIVNPPDRDRINVAGATFPARLYEKWFDEFNKAQQKKGPFPHLSTYDAIGSDAGKQGLFSGDLDFAASDWPLSSGLARTTRGGLLQVPSVIGAVVPAYNVKEVTTGLHLTRQLVADIFSTAVKWWDDPNLVRLNPKADLPHRRIKTLHRSDGSGTTHILSVYMTYPGTSWRGGIGDIVRWPSGTEAEGSDGMARNISMTQDSIGYVEYYYAMQSNLNIRFGCIENKQGDCKFPDIGTIGNANCPNALSDPETLQQCVIDSSNEGAYPIAAFTWLLVPIHVKDADKRKVITDFLNWMLTDGQNWATGFAFAPLPQQTVAQEMQAVKQIAP